LDAVRYEEINCKKQCWTGEGYDTYVSNTREAALKYESISKIRNTPNIRRSEVLVVAKEQLRIA
jgi:hypothetical protein